MEPSVAPDVIGSATTAAFGIAAAGVIVASRTMTRREVIYHVAGAAVLGATVPPVVMQTMGLPQVWSWLLGVACGFSVPLIIGQVQKYIAKKGEEITGDKP